MARLRALLPALALAVAIGLLAGCGGGRPAPDDVSAHAALAGGRSGAEVTVSGTVAAQPEEVGTHEHLVVTTPLGDRLEIDHNTDLAPWVPAGTGDAVVVHGQLYVDAPGQAGVHCTHARTSRGCPLPGWIELRGTYYE